MVRKQLNRLRCASAHTTYHEVSTSVCLKTAILRKGLPEACFVLSADSNLNKKTKLRADFRLTHRISLLRGREHTGGVRPRRP
jgi:hypothetical protein